jgi:antitoxin VapB
MTLQIRDARARELAQELAERRQVTMTAAVIQALEEELRRENAKTKLADRIARITADLRAQAGKQGRAMTKAEIDALWGHS